MVVEILAKGN